MPRCLQQYLTSFFCNITNFNAANSEMVRVNTFVTELLVLFHRRENSQNKQAAEEIHSFPSLKHEIVWKQHTKFLNWARDDSKTYAATKTFFALEGRTDIMKHNCYRPLRRDCNIAHMNLNSRTDSIMLTMLECMRLTCCVLPQGKHSTFVYNCL